MPQAAITISECAAELGMTAKQIRYLIAQGAPVVTRGSRGRGNSTLLDSAAISAWLNSRGTFTKNHHLQLARELTQSVAEAAVSQFRAQSGPHKRALAVNILEQFENTAQAIRRQLELPPMAAAEIPEAIQQIAKAVGILSR